MRIACHDDEAFARLGKDVAKARERADVAWTAAKGEQLWGRAMRGARQALETERYRVDRHAQSSEDYYAVVRGRPAAWHASSTRVEGRPRYSAIEYTPARQ